MFSPFRQSLFIPNARTHTIHSFDGLDKVQFWYVLQSINTSFPNARFPFQYLWGSNDNALGWCKVGGATFVCGTRRQTKPSKQQEGAECLHVSTTGFVSKQSLFLNEKSNMRSGTDCRSMRWVGTHRFRTIHFFVLFWTLGLNLGCRYSGG